MAYPYRGFESGEEEHRHHHPHRPHHPPSSDRSAEQEEYGGYAPPYPQAHDTHTPPPGPYGTHPPAGPYGTDNSSGPYGTHPPSGPYGTDNSSGPYGTHPPSGPYGTHDSSGPVYSQRHDGAPHGVYPPEHAHSGRMLPEGQILRVFCKGNSAFNLAVDRNTVVMQPADSQNEAQQWIKDSSYGLRVKDNYGHPAFSLVNKKTQKILKHSKEKGKQVLLMDYRPDIHDDDILWSESQDFGEGFKTVRAASDTLLNLTVFEGNKKIRNGSALVLDSWHQGDHQLWKLFAM